MFPFFLVSRMNASDVQEPIAVMNWPRNYSVSGNVNVSNFPATQNVSGSVSVANFPSTQTVNGTVIVSGARMASTVITSSYSVTAAAPVTIAAANPNRVKLMVTNDSGTLYLMLGPNANSNFYLFKMSAGQEQDITNFTGMITAIKGSGTSVVYVADLQ